MIFVTGESQLGHNDSLRPFVNLTYLIVKHRIHNYIVYLLLSYARSMSVDSMTKFLLRVFGYVVRHVDTIMVHK